MMTTEPTATERTGALLTAVEHHSPIQVVREAYVLARRTNEADRIHWALIDALVRDAYGPRGLTEVRRAAGLAN
jgi:hypothetical protein